MPIVSAKILRVLTRTPKALIGSNRFLGAALLGLGLGLLAGGIALLKRNATRNEFLPTGG